MEFNYRKALVTGGAGFIGSHIVEELLKMGVEVISIDNYIGGKPENLANLPNQYLLNEVNCDVTDYNHLKQYFPGIDIVFHEAASKKTICLNNPRLDLKINAEGTFNILELARDFNVRKVVHASTGSVYGEARVFPQDENHSLVPTSYYGVSKLAGEKYVKAFNHLYGLNTTVLRYFHVYGPRQESADDRGGLVAIFLMRSLANKSLTINGDGTQQRSFTYVKDVVKANLLAAMAPQSTGEVYNCASGLKVTIKQLADQVLLICGQPALRIDYAEWTPGDIKVFDIDHSKITQLGLNQWTSLDNGLSETYQWYKQNFADFSTLE